MPRIGPVLIVALALALPGCSDDRALVVATPWGRADCLELEAAFRSERPTSGPPIRWVRLASWDDPARLIRARSRVDVLIGWPEITLEGLRLRGLVAPPVASGGSPPGLAPGSLGDPRLDPEARAEVARELARGGWRDGYARLLGRSATADPAEAAAIVPSGGGRPGASALVIASGHPDAGSLLEFVSGRLGAGGPVFSEPIDAGVIRVAAELIGATAIDAGKELRSAWSATEGAPDADAVRALLVEPPPWPPASIRALRDDPERRALLETLAGAIAGGGQARAWLLASWERPSRPIDRALVAELASAGGGALLDEPHLLPWLRAEWTAWARQRARHVAREIGPGGVER